MIALLLAAHLAHADTVPDRTAPPAVTPATLMALPDAVVETLRPGVRIHWLDVPGVRRVEVSVQLGRGSLWLDDGAPSPASAMTGELWTTAARGWSSAALAETSSLHDVALWSSVDLRTSTVGVSSPADELPLALELLAATLRAPTFPGREVARNIDDTVQAWTIGLPTTPDSLAWLALESAWYPAGDPRDPRLDLADLRAVRRADLVSRATRLLAGAPLDVVVVGDIDPDALRTQVSALVDGLGADGPVSPRLPARAAGVTAVIAVDVPDADQAILSVRTAAPPRDHADEASLNVLQFALGGQFLSRLNLNLREEKGWTYGGYSDYERDLVGGTWSYATEVAEANAGPALDEILGELTRAATGATPDEASASRAAEVAAWNITLESADSASVIPARALLWGADVATSRARMERLVAVDVAQTGAVAERWLNGTDRVIVVVGDRKVLEPQLTARFPSVSWVSPREVATGKVTVGRAE